MNVVHIATIALSVLNIFIAQPAASAMYKWVDENGRTHYGDRMPPHYTNQASARLIRASAVPVKVARVEGPQEARASEQELERQKIEAIRELDQQRRDNVLLMTYVDEKEIDRARERELKRNQDTIKMATAALDKSAQSEDRTKLQLLLNIGRKETEAINAKFDAQKLRYRELTGAVPILAWTLYTGP